MEATENIQLEKKKGNWTNYTIKSLAFWVILALIGGVIFGTILFNKDSNPRSVLKSVELIEKKERLGTLDANEIFNLSVRIENSNLTQQEIADIRQKASLNIHPIYVDMANYQSKVAQRQELTNKLNELKEKEKNSKLTADEESELAEMTAQRSGVIKEIGEVLRKIRANSLTNDEIVVLNEKLANDSFTKELAALKILPTTSSEYNTLKEKVDSQIIDAKEKHAEITDTKSVNQKGIQWFIKILKWMVGPIIFVTIILGIVGLESLKELGSIGLKAFIYFEIVSTLALAIGILFGNFFAPGKGMDIDPNSLDSSKVQGFIEKAEGSGGGVLAVLKGAIPTDPITPFTQGKTLQVLVMAFVIAIVIAVFVKNKHRILKPFEIAQHYLFKVLLIFMWLSPIATFCAMTFLIAEYGLASLLNMGQLLLVMLGACLTFIFVVLGSILAYFKISIFKFMRYIYKEVLIVFATSSSESALAPLMRRLEASGISKSVTGLVIPTGYSFNLDCTNIYLSLSVIFLAQAINVDLTLIQQLGIIIVLMVTSKGAVGVTGSGFIVLAATIGAMPDAGIPVVVVTILLGIDKFMSEMRAVGNLCGNSVACVVVALWDKQVDIKKFKYTLDNPSSVQNVL